MTVKKSRIPTRTRAMATREVFNAHVLLFVPLAGFIPSDGVPNGDWKFPFVDCGTETVGADGAWTPVPHWSQKEAVPSTAEPHFVQKRLI